MKVENLFYIILFIFLSLNGCLPSETADDNSTLLVIKLSQDSSSVELHGIPADVLADFKADSLTEKEWNSFFAVYLEPANPELREIQRPLKGTYQVIGSMVSFTPLEFFQKKHSYFVHCYARKLFVEPADIIKSGKLPSKNSVQEVVFDF
ncbi:hypothetical protein [Daejeonella oryzae]|uniref:hypothetical protein n=1 Tax=Daejeonella oryzae TaxID=1122943 RepID=UPI00047DD4E2|nr:hypothetical protein [Daejeonella oryzae]